MAGFFRSQFRRRLAAAFVAAMLVMIAVVAVAYRSTRASIAAARWVAHTHEVISTLEELHTFLLSAETNQRAYVITGQADYAERARAMRPLIEQRLEHLDGLVADNRSEVERLHQLRQAIRVRLGMSDQMTMLRAVAGFNAAQAFSLSGTPRHAMARVEEIISSMRATEQGLLIVRAKESERRATHTLMMVSLGGLIDIVLLSVVFVLVDRTHQRTPAP
jgi:CHASE3 domain sensor protein